VRDAGDGLQLPHDLNTVCACIDAYLQQHVSRHHVQAVDIDRSAPMNDRTATEPPAPNINLCSNSFSVTLLLIGVIFYMFEVVSAGHEIIITTCVEYINPLYKKLKPSLRKIGQELSRNCVLNFTLSARRRGHQSFTEV
jgi:hypothetical protein